MNFNAISKKLQRAIMSKGLIIKIGTSQFYLEDQKRMVTMYILSTPVMYENTAGEWRIKDHEIIRTASGIDMVTCLADIWEQMKEWGNANRLA